MATYEKITKDDIVSDIKSVKVKKISQKESVEEFSLSDIDGTLSAIQEKIDAYTDRRDALLNVRKEIEKEAKKVKLYVPDTSIDFEEELG